MTDAQTIAPGAAAVTCSPGAVLVCTDRPRYDDPPNEKNFNLYALQTHTNLGDRVKITIAAAHADTFHPGFKSIEINVKPKPPPVPVVEGAAVVEKDTRKDESPGRLVEDVTV